LKLLLDTHIWLWSLREPDRLGAQTRRELADPHNERWLSPVSTWEALILIDKKRIRLNENEDPDLWLMDSIKPFREAPFTHQIAAASQRLNLPQRDPADRFLAATAKVLGLTLVTADTNLLGLGDIATLGNR
jgi:PIN domain nuclease of toxin-antitoxin system